MSLIQSFVKVEFIDPIRDLDKQRSYYGYTWRASENWMLSVPLRIAEQCEKSHGCFKVFWPTETSDELKDRVDDLERRILDLEGGHGDNGDTPHKRGRPPKKGEG